MEFPNETGIPPLIRRFRPREQRLAFSALDAMISNLGEGQKICLAQFPVVLRLSPQWLSTETRNSLLHLPMSLSSHPDFVVGVLAAIGGRIPTPPALVVLITYADGESFGGVFDKAGLGSTLLAMVRPKSVVQRYLMTPGERHNFYETFDPGLWRDCYPRQYTEPKCGKYYSPKAPARLLMEAALHALDDPGLLKLVDGPLITGGKYTESVTFYLASHLAGLDTPTYWVGESIASAMEQTSPPGEINWPEMLLPHEACVFMMPKGSLTHDASGDIAFIAYARLQPGQVYSSALAASTRYGFQDGVIIFYLETTTGTGLHFTMSERVMPVLTLPDLKSLVTGEMYPESPGLKDMTSADRRVLWLAVHYIFSMIFPILDRPGIVTPACLEKRVPAKRSDPPREIWSPNIIGENYHVRHEPRSLGGLHNSPRFHWVRGFWREQACGSQLTLRKRIWIEPHTRGVSDDDE